MGDDTSNNCYDFAVRTTNDIDPLDGTKAYGLYVHIPFCDSKCGYCDFFSIVVKTCPTAPLVQSLVQELGTRLPVADHQIETVFFGGGTPTVLPTDELRIILDALQRVVDLSLVREFTVEANPATIDDEKAGLLHGSGVTRVSMGAQSFLPSELAVLERLHTPDDIAPSVAALRRAGIPQLNLDLIFGIPGQTLATWSESLAKAIDLDPDHIACYGLTYEPGTRLTAQRRLKKVIPTPESLEAEMHLFTIDALGRAGFAQYEISNYAKPGFECKHNINYWRNGPCVSVGPSATGCFDGRRYKNIANVTQYVAMMNEFGHAEAEIEAIDTPMLITEMIMMQLRLVQGLCIADFHLRTGSDPLTQLQPQLDRMVDLGFIVVSDTHIALTGKGQLVGDAVIGELVDSIGPVTETLNNALPGTLQPAGCSKPSPRLG